MTIAPVTSVANTAFARDTMTGLSSTPKRLSSKYFYDAEGDRLFQAIMNMPSYYLTNCEFDIFQEHKEAMLQLIGDDHFDLVELGAGDGSKTKVLLQHFLKEKADFTYCPVDISGNVLQQLGADLKQSMPELDFDCMQGDYFEMLDELHYRSSARKVILFLGANIGNLSPEAASNFIKQLYDHMDTGDLLLIGFDLKKDPQTVLDAYNDPEGITAAFNLNLLTRMNRELGADFELENFKHWETYNPLTGATKSYIISKKNQSVFFTKLNKTVHFSAWEAIDVELSQKYSITEIEQLAQKAGFTVKHHYTDQKAYFVDSIWEK